jgi:hypothetical protein
MAQNPFGLEIGENLTFDDVPLEDQSPRFICHSLDNSCLLPTPENFLPEP